MGILSRMSTVVKSKMNRILDNAEDPNETLDYAYEKQMETLRDVKARRGGDGYRQAPSRTSGV